MSRLATAVRARSPIWWAVLAVAACGVVATAHGLFEVTRASGVSPVVAALYVPITDGLALVAYAATDRLRSWSRAYAWTVVLLAAGLSATAQAMQLGGLGEPPVELRYGVGAWPAVAVAVAAHLLWLVARPVAEPVAPQVSEVATVVAEPATAGEQDALATTAAEVAPVAAEEPDPVADQSVRPLAPVAIHRPRAVAATTPRRSQVSASATPTRREKGPCVDGCDRHGGPVSYDTRRRCADRLTASATA